MYDKIHHKQKKKIVLEISYAIHIFCLFCSLICLFVSSQLFEDALKRESESEVVQSCPTLCDPVDCSPSDSSVHRILQARILEWVAISFSRGSSQPRGRYLSSTPSNFLSCPALNTPWTVEKFYLKSNLSDFFWSFSPGNRGGNFI